VDKFPTPNEIASRAHDLFVAGGRRVTKVFEYWRQAEQELLDLTARRTVSSTAEQRSARHRPGARRDWSN